MGLVATTALIAKVKSSSVQLNFGNDADAAYHAHKHAGELGPVPDPKTEMVDYLQAARDRDVRKEQLMSAAEILDDIARSLAAAKNGERDAIRPAMIGFESLAKLVHEGEVRWEDLRPWASTHVEAVDAARFAFEEWSRWTHRTFAHGGEEEAERALDLRSQLEFARQLFAATPAIETLANMTDPEIDEEYREQAERLALDPPDFVPRSHTWWRWTKRT